MSALPKDSLVLVTGANGWVGSHTVDQLLKAEYRVRGTVREAAKGEWLKEYANSEYGPNRLEIFVLPDMSVKGAFDEAVKGTSAFIHVASDLSFSGDPEKVITPTVKGAEHALEAATREPMIKHFVYTSSVAAVGVADLKTELDVTENTWNDVSEKLAYDDTQDPPMRMLHCYCASKSLAEKAVLRFASEHKPHFKVNTVVPNFNLGPRLSPKQEKLSSGQVIPDFYKGGWDGLGMWKAYPSQHYIDVRDDAKLHVAPLLDPTIRDNERLFAVAYVYTWNEILETMRKLRPNHKFPEPSDDTRRDRFNYTTKARAEEILRKNFGHGFTLLPEIVEANLAHVD